MTPMRPHPLLPNDASLPEVIAAQSESDTSDWRFRRPILQQWPEQYACQIAKHYADLYQREGRRIANLYMLDVKDDQSHLVIKLAASDSDLIAAANKLSERCKRLRYIAKSDEIALYALKLFITEHYKIFPPLLTKQNDPSMKGSYTNTGILNRLCNEHWWRRTLRSVQVRNVEQHAIRSGFVHRNAGLYISDVGFQHYLQQQRRNSRVLEQCIAVNETTGDEFSLMDIVQKSLANPRCRRAELMTRIRGFEEVSKDLGHVAMFYTMTCPSRMHSYKTIMNASGKTKSFPNPKYDKTTPIAAQKYLNRIWAQIRSKLKRDVLDYYGFRVTEAHHDGTPHWHLLIFMDPGIEYTITEIIRAYSLREDREEAGALKHRFKAEKIDPTKGSATGYIAKYITKGLDGFGLDVDLYGKDAKTSSQRVRGWASTWGIRQFQQLGGPPVTIYRELRRISGSELSGLIEEIQKAADSGDWQQFVKLMGGPTLARKDYIVSVSKQWNDKPNRYEEPTGYQIIGVNWGKVVITTRIYQWRIEYRKKIENKLPIKKLIEANNSNPMSLNRGLLAPLEYCQ